ncbi:MAG: DUF2845 domain-containing protein [Clostridia bacterium]|nr:DUF2845 domain-containing protein [Clostridia bacterium]
MISFLLVIFIIAMSVYVLVTHYSRTIRFKNVKDCLKVGMTESEMIEKCGSPSSSIDVYENTKVVSYMYSKEFIRGLTKNYQILAVIEDGVVVNVSKSE